MNNLKNKTELELNIILQKLLKEKRDRVLRGNILYNSNIKFQ